MAKLLKLRRGSTSAHASFTGAEGEVTIDTTKDTAVVHDGSQAGGRPLAREDMSNVSSASIAGQLGTDSIAVGKIAAGTLPSDVKVTDANVSGNLTIESADIVNGTIVNADVNTGAAIAGTKISPDFGSQKIATTGEVEATSLDINGAGNPVQIDHTGGAAVSMNRGGKSLTFNANYGAAGTHAAIDTNCTDLRLQRGGVDRVAVNNSGMSVTGNISVSGTVDGRDVASDGSKLDGIESGATGDQSNSEIKTAYEANSNTNAFTDALLSKLNGIESGATADQSGSEIASALQGQNIANSTNGINNIYNSGWYRNNESGEGMYNQSTGQHFYSDHDDYWNIAGGGSANALRFRDDHNSTVRGYCYADNNNQIGFLNSSASWSLRCDNSGNVTATGNVTAYSDERLKTNVKTINNALSIVGKLRGVSFDWKESGKHSIGVIAQEVEKVLPEVVLTSQVLDPTGESEVKSVDYGKIVGVLINAINELKAEVDELKGGK